MSERIEVGDLVVIVKSKDCCGDSSHVGMCFTVSGFHHESICLQCGTVHQQQAAFWDGRWVATPVWRLRKIPPISELESTEHKEEVPA